MTELIRDFSKDDAGIDYREGEMCGVVHFSAQVHDSLLARHGIYPYEHRVWHDLEIDAYQDVESYMCDECDVVFLPMKLAVIEDPCEEHRYDGSKLIYE